MTTHACAACVLQEEVHGTDDTAARVTVGNIKRVTVGNIKRCRRCAGVCQCGKVLVGQ